MRGQQLWVRVGLLYLLFVNGVTGIWATVSPRSFYDDFPGGGHVWVGGDGPYNEHLVRDIGSWSLGLAVVVLAAAVLLTRASVIVAGSAAAAASLPHALYHSRHSDVIGSTVDQVLSIGGLWFAGLVAVVLVVAAMRWKEGGSERGEEVRPAARKAYR